MEMDDDPDPEMPPTGTPAHPISISSGSSYAGSPHQGPDSWAERWNTYKWVFTPSFHNFLHNLHWRNCIFRRLLHRHFPLRNHRNNHNSYLLSNQGGGGMHECPCKGD
ncbi:hypothetical protein Hanom_Chr04g00338201 [Helianthus anomalus]